MKSTCRSCWFLVEIFCGNSRAVLRYNIVWSIELDELGLWVFGILVSRIVW